MKQPLCGIIPTKSIGICPILIADSNNLLIKSGLRNEGCYILPLLKTDVQKSPLHLQPSSQTFLLYFMLPVFLTPFLKGRSFRNYYSMIKKNTSSHLYHKSEWKQTTRVETQFLLFFVIPVMSGSAKNFQLSQKRPSKVDLPKLTFKELEKLLRNETMVKFRQSCCESEAPRPERIKSQKPTVYADITKHWLEDQ
jgi:hypothetical protein